MASPCSAAWRTKRAPAASSCGTPRPLRVHDAEQELLAGTSLLGGALDGLRIVRRQQTQLAEQVVERVSPFGGPPDGLNTAVLRHPDIQLPQGAQILRHGPAVFQLRGW